MNAVIFFRASPSLSLKGGGSSSEPNDPPSPESAQCSAIVWMIKTDSEVVYSFYGLHRTRYNRLLNWLCLQARSRVGGEGRSASGQSDLRLLCGGVRPSVRTRLSERRRRRTTSVSRAAAAGPPGNSRTLRRIGRHRPCTNISTV